MKIDLTTLKPNRWREFGIDPLEEERAEIIQQSINDTGFWGGVPVFKLPDGSLEIGAGHVRVYAAIKAGIKQADLVVQPYSHEKSIRILATENVTQRGHIGPAMTASVGAATRYILKGVLQNDQTFGKYFPKVNGFESARGNVASSRGLGHEVVLRFFEGIKGMNESIVREHLTQLKESGHYARIVKEVHDEIAKEQEAERAKLERQEAQAAAKKKAAEEAAKKAAETKDKEDKAAAKVAKEEAKEAEAKLKQNEVKKAKEASEKAVEAAAKKPVTFDLQGVGRWLGSQSLIRTFRKVMAQESIRKSVPVSSQEDLAAWLVHRANTTNEGKLTANFIKDNLPNLIMGASRKELKLSNAEKNEIGVETAQATFTDRAHHFCRNMAGVFRDAKDMLDLKDKYPGLDFKITRELIDTVRMAKPYIDKLYRKLGI